MSGGAAALASIYGSELDKVNCPFYIKIGACRHGSRCARRHPQPQFSQTVLFTNLWPNPLCMLAEAGLDERELDRRRAQDEFDAFFFEIFEELSKYGKVEELHVCDNVADHLVGNVYAKFDDEEEADDARRALDGTFYGGRQIRASFVPVTNLREARCRQYDEGQCHREGLCNFLHVKRASRGLQREIIERYGPMPGLPYRPRRRPGDIVRNYHPDFEPRPRRAAPDGPASERGGPDALGDAPRVPPGYGEHPGARAEDRPPPRDGGRSPPLPI